LRRLAALYKTPKDRKKAVVAELQDLLRRYRVVAVADITGLRASAFQRLRAKLRGRVVVKVAKNTLMRKAVEGVAEVKPGIEKLIDGLRGPNAFIFTNEGAFTLHMLLERSKVAAKAKPGDRVSRDVYIPAGNTGLPPGPVLSVFKKLKVPTKIEEGSIHVVKDTLILRRGEQVSEEAADLLAKLGVEPVEVGLSVKVAYEDGVLFKAEDLALNLEAYRRQLVEAHEEALRLSVALAYPAVEALPHLIAKAQAEALRLSVKAAYPARGSIEALLRVAAAEAAALSARLHLS
jgi:large subunit ribosomal protein L10